MKYIKQYDELKFTDDFMFWNILVYRPDLCKSLIELILNIEIQKIDMPEGQKTICTNYDSHGIRLDVYLNDDQNTVYDLEMQTTHFSNLPKRTRYYQSSIDQDFLKKGNHYSRLNKSFIIFFCTDDPFGYHFPIYSFQNICLQDKSLILQDESYKIIINPNSKRDGLSSEMNSFLDLLQGKTELCGLAKDISDAIIEEKHHRRWEVNYMTLYDKFVEERELGRNEGRENTIFELVQEGICPPVLGAEKLNVTENEFIRMMTEAGYKIPTIL